MNNYWFKWDCLGWAQEINQGRDRRTGVDIEGVS